VAVTECYELVKRLLDTLDVARDVLCAPTSMRPSITLPCTLTKSIDQVAQRTMGRAKWRGEERRGEERRGEEKRGEERRGGEGSGGKLRGEEAGTIGKHLARGVLARRIADLGGAAPQ
jgi:hypothetical protein